MIQPIQQGFALIRDIEESQCATPRLWWLGQSGFAIRYHDIIFYVDPFLSARVDRLTASPMDPRLVRHADMVLCTHKHPSHMDAGSLPHILESSPRARLVLPKSIAGRANAFGVDYRRMTTTDADLRIEYFKTGEYGRIYAAPSAHESLEWTAATGYPYLGYLLRFGEFTIYHAGDGVPYDGLAARLRPYNVTVALVPISGRGGGNFEIHEAAQLAEEIGTRWLAPMHYDMFEHDTADVNRFIEHMLGQRPLQRFKVFQCGEGWSIPDSDEE
jgi:L-ascorbate metabolism protein UlaG (beta-lactamase superfamily)